MSFHPTSYNGTKSLRAPHPSAFDSDRIKKQLWQRITEKNSMEGWFHPLGFSFSSSQGGTLHVHLPHALFYRWFMDLGKDLLENSARSLYGDSIRIRYEWPGNIYSSLLEKSPSLTTTVQKPEAASWTASFDTFLTGGKNKESIQIFRRALRLSPCTIFLHGTSGTGKSHLLRAAALELKEHVSGPILSLSGRELLALFQRSSELAHNTLASCSALIVDDIQLIEKHHYVQQELCSLLDSLEGKAFILVSCQTESKEYLASLLIPSLYDRLCSYLSLALEEPDLDVRLRFAQNEMERISLPEHRSTALFLARRCFRLRHIRGLLEQVRMSYEQDAVLPSQEKLSSLMNRAGIPQPSDIDSILAAVAAHYGCTSDQLRENNKEKRLTLPRQIAMFLCRDILGESFPSIGLIFGGRDHSTVIYTTRKIEKMKVTNKDMNIQLTELTKQCRNIVPRRKT